MVVPEPIPNPRPYAVQAYRMITGEDPETFFDMGDCLQASGNRGCVSASSDPYDIGWRASCLFYDKDGVLELVRSVTGDNAQDVCERLTR